MSTVNRKPRQTGGSLPPFYERADKLLRLAEQLQDKCDQYASRLETGLASGVILTAAFVGAMAYLIPHAPVDERGYLWAACAGLYSVAVVGYLYLWRGRIRERLARDERAMLRIVDMLREIEPGMVGGDTLSTLEQIEFRIRLSRFDIGPGTSPASTSPRR